MPRLARRSAGADVSASAQQLSDDTLTLEEQAFAEIDAIYADAASAARAAILAARSFTPRAPLWDELAAIVIAAGGATTIAVGVLLAKAVSSAVSALADQLSTCEATLGSDFAGTALVALGAVTVEDATAAAQSSYSSTVDEIVARSLADVDREARRWRSTQSRGDRAESPEVLADRLTSEQVRSTSMSGRGLIRRPATSLRSSARAESVGAANDVAQAGAGTFNDEARRRGMDGDPIRKQVLAHIDKGTTVVCLHAAGQIKPIDEPFDTLAGKFQRPPFHWGCRSLVIPWMPGMIQPHRDQANAELRARPKAERRIGPGGEIGGRIPGSPDDRNPLGVDELPADFVDAPDLKLDDLPNEARLPYMRAHPERFSLYATGAESWWVTDSAGTRWNLRK